MQVRVRVVRVCQLDGLRTHARQPLPHCRVHCKQEGGFEHGAQQRGGQAPATEAAAAAAAAEASKNNISMHIIAATATEQKQEQQHQQQLQRQAATTAEQ